MPAWAELSASAEQVARRLLGSELALTTAQGATKVRIVETEAYHQADAASHSFKGRTPRTEIMFGPAGYLYVYFTYGMHYCCNVVTGPAGEGSAVLIRAVEPLEDEDFLQRNRPNQTGVAITNGPAKLCQALGITKQLNGHNLLEQPLELRLCEPLKASQIITTTRVGISQAKDEPLRFYIKDNPYVSKL